MTRAGRGRLRRGSRRARTCRPIWRACTSSTKRGFRSRRGEGASAGGVAVSGLEMSQRLVRATTRARFCRFASREPPCRHCGTRKWRPDRESNPGARICSPLRHHSAIGPRRAQMRGFAGVVKRRSRFLPFRRSVVGMLLGKKPGTARAGKLPGEIVLDHRAPAAAAHADPPTVNHARMPSGANMVSRRAPQKLHHVHFECHTSRLFGANLLHSTNHMMINWRFHEFVARIGSFALS